MVDFNLTEQQEMLVELARDFADDELIPNAEKWDTEGTFNAEKLWVNRNVRPLLQHRSTNFIPIAQNFAGDSSKSSVQFREDSVSTPTPTVGTYS